MSQAPSWDDLYRSSAARLCDRREARWMIEEASGESFGRAVGQPSEKAQLRLGEMVERRLAGEPLQYVLGSWPFRRVDLMVDRRVLIPRPETEQVVEVALTELDRIVSLKDPDKQTTAVDLGTGSGAIALSLARERKAVEVWAVDNSPEALAVARANLCGVGGYAATRVRIVEGDWWDGLPDAMRGHVDLLVSNPPYVTSAEMTQLDPQVREWEPRLALESGPSGTEAIEAILAGAPEWLSRPAAAVIEIGFEQAEAASAVALSAGADAVRVEPDLAGRPRALVARWDR